MPGGRPPIDEKKRFLAKVKVVQSGCHEWQGSKNWQGYGKVYFRGVSSYPAHRASYALFVGEIPDGLNVLHECDNKPCVNPKHLFLGSLADNIADMDAKARRGTRSQLTYNDVAEIKDMLAARYSQTEIARRFSVHQTTISKIALKKSFLFKEN
jgi:hypothetical protein